METDSDERQEVNRMWYEVKQIAQEAKLQHQKYMDWERKREQDREREVQGVSKDNLIDEIRPSDVSSNSEDISILYATRVSPSLFQFSFDPSIITHQTLVILPSFLQTWVWRQKKMV